MIESQQRCVCCGAYIVVSLASQCSHECATVAFSNEEAPVVFSPLPALPVPTRADLCSDILSSDKLVQGAVTSGIYTTSSDYCSIVDQCYPDFSRPFSVPTAIDIQDWLNTSMPLRPAAYQTCPTTFIAAAASSSEEAADGVENGTSRDANADSSASRAHLGGQSGYKYLIPSVIGRGKEDDPSPDPPPPSAGDTPSHCLEGGEHGFLCAFHNNPRQDKFRMHRRARKRFVSQLK